MVNEEDDPETAASAQLAGWFLDPSQLDPEQRRPGVVTGLTVLVVDPTPGAVAAVTALVAAVSGDFRVDVLVAAADGAEVWWPDLDGRLDDLGVRHRLVPVPGPGTPAAFEALSAAAGGEFVVVVRGSLPDVSSLVPGLLRVWIDGGDALVLPERSTSSGSPADPVPVAEVVAVHLVDLLGLGDGPVRGLVVVRRWLARRLGDELSRVADPATEVLDRLRAVGATLVELPVDPA